MQKKSTSQKATTTRTIRSGTEQDVQKSAALRTELTQALATGAARLPASEEKAVRMIHGIGAPRTLVLERVGQNNPDTRARLLDIELELLRQARARAAKAPVAQAAPASAAPANPKRARIVAALKSAKSAR